MWIYGAEDSGDAAAASARSDSAGRFVLNGLSPGIYRVEAARGDRMTARRDQVLVGPQGAFGLVLLLEPGAVVIGRVLASDGQPFEGAVVCVGPPRRPSPAEIESWSRVTRAEAGLCVRSGAAGAFSVTGLPRDSRLVARAARPGRHYTDQGAVELPTSRSRIDRIELRLPPPIPVIGRIELPDGRPFSGPATLSGGPGFEVRDGKVATEVEQAGRRCVFIDGFCVVCRELVPGERGVADFGTIRLDPGVRIEGSVRDQAGRPIPAATITGDCGGSHRRTHSDEDGSFVLSGIDERRDEHGALRCGFSVEAAGFESRVVGFVPGAQPGAVLMEATGAVEGRVVTGTPPQPVPGLSIRAVPDGMPGGPTITLSTPDGRFRLHNLAAGRYSLRLESPGFVPRWIFDLRVEPDTRLSLGDVALERGHVLRGRLVEGASVSGSAGPVFAQSPTPCPMEAAWQGRSGPTRTGCSCWRAWPQEGSYCRSKLPIADPSSARWICPRPGRRRSRSRATVRSSESPAWLRASRWWAASSCAKRAGEEAARRRGSCGSIPVRRCRTRDVGALRPRGWRILAPNEHSGVVDRASAGESTWKPARDARIGHVEQGWNYPVVATLWRRLDGPRSDRGVVCRGSLRRLAVGPPAESGDLRSRAPGRSRLVRGTVSGRSSSTCASRRRDQCGSRHPGRGSPGPSSTGAAPRSKGRASRDPARARNRVRGAGARQGTDALGRFEFQRLQHGTSRSSRFRTPVRPEAGRLDRGGARGAHGRTAARADRGATGAHPGDRPARRPVPDAEVVHARRSALRDPTRTSRQTKQAA